MSTASSSSAIPPLLIGSIPGLLDPSQPARLLRNQYSQLLFASFHPQTASPDQDIFNFKSLSLHDELYRPKRVVIEITPDGSFWRFVPRARREEGDTDESLWPKLVDICGQIVNCHQDQWDIYMLDPAYTCLFRAAPQLPLIARNESFESMPHRTPDPSLKRRMGSSSPDLHFDTTTPLAKKTRSAARVDTDDDEDEVENIISNDVPRPRPTSFGFQRAKSKLRAETEKKRKIRREKMRRLSTQSSLQDVFEDQVMAELTPAETPSTPPRSQSTGTFGATKRTGSERKQGLATDSDTETGEESVRPHVKRTRTNSPASIKRELVGKRIERGKQRAREKKLKQEQLRRARQEAFEQELYGSYETYMNSRSQSQSTAQDVDSDSDKVEEPDLEDLAQQRIEESRRKLAELEKDRPLWEEAAKKRIQQEEADERARQAVKDASRRQEEAGRREKERLEFEARERAQREGIERERAIRRERERKRAQNKSRWARGPWTVQRALERYRYLCEQFDNAKYSPSEPLIFEDVPWPMAAISFSVEDIAWSAVEQFFESVKPYMRSQEYKVFVETSHRRFHPDRWRARGLLKSMQDDEERECLEVAANTVAQALTPLWRQVKQ